jgi:hypothetical protein
MDMASTEKKLREARFFLDKMSEHERMAVQHKEPFEFYLSAFLSAGRTVDYRLRHEQPATYPTWRTKWNTTLANAEERLITFMVDDRNVEVHASGSSRTIKTENRELGAGTYKFASGTMEVFGPSWVHPLAIIPVLAYSFTIDGAERNATDVCAEYLSLLERMVEAFRADRL